jgi:hypothetical protein
MSVDHWAAEKAGSLAELMVDEWAALLVAWRVDLTAVLKAES